MRRVSSQGRLYYGAAVGALLLMSLPSFAQQLFWVGTFPQGGWSWAFDVSDDGCVVVGASDMGGLQRAYRWVRQGATGTMYNLGTIMFSYGNSVARAVSADGRIVTGVAPSPFNSITTFIWSADTNQMVNIGAHDARNEGAGISRDGRVVVGYTETRIPRPSDRATRWVRQSTGGWNYGCLGALCTIHSSYATAVSDDGRTVVGRLQYQPFTTWYAFRWRDVPPDGSLQPLYIGYGDTRSEAHGVSADGRVVVGYYLLSGDDRAFRWVASADNSTGTWSDLGDVGGGRSQAHGVSADGNTVVGWSLDSQGNTVAIRWTPAHGMENLNQRFAALLSNGSRLTFAYAASADGRYIVGTGYNATTGREEGFLLDTWRAGDTNGDGCINNSDLLAVLFAFGTPGTGLTRHEDINKDGVVNNADLLSVLFGFGQGC